MGIRLEDGLGSGKSAGVTTYHQLQTKATTEPVLSFASSRGESFVVYTKHQIQADDTNEQVFFIKNASATKHVHLHEVIFTVNSNTDGYGVKWEMYFDTTRSGGGTAFTPLNMNRGSGKRSEGTL